VATCRAGDLGLRQVDRVGERHAGPFAREQGFEATSHDIRGALNILFGHHNAHLERASRERLTLFGIRLDKTEHTRVKQRPFNFSAPTHAQMHHRNRLLLCERGARGLELLLDLAVSRLINQIDPTAAAARKSGTKA
jgi:hypothetical protein